MPGTECDLHRIPTVELHRHFEAGLRPEMIARLAQRNHLTEARTRTGLLIEELDPCDPESIRRYYAEIATRFPGPGGFARFVDSFGVALGVFRTPEDLEEAVFDQLIDCAEGGSLHTELRGSPLTYGEHVAASHDEIVQALVGGVQRAWDERRVSGTFLLAFSRQRGLPGYDKVLPGGQAAPVAELAAKYHRPDCPVGLDIAGFPETTFPPLAFVEPLRSAREAGVPLTVHSGEQGEPPHFHDAPPTLIVEAVERLGATRIGHGTSLVASADVRTFVRERGVAVECCPVSNERMGFVRIPDHPLPLFLREHLLVSIGTDDPLMFGPFSVTDTFAAIAGPLGLQPSDLVQLTLNGLGSAFITEERRQQLRARLEAAGF
jgi:adenosine deaminase